MKQAIFLKRGQYFSPDAAARAIGLTQGRIRQLIRSGAIQAIQISPHSWLIPEAQLRKRLPGLGLQKSVKKSKKPS